jgi:hypothetical protein
MSQDIKGEGILRLKETLWQMKWQNRLLLGTRHRPWTEKFAKLS